jgi:hypothetical protein
MALSSRDNPIQRGNGAAAHAAEVEKGARSREVLAETANESPLSFDGTTAEKALQTVAKVADLDDKDEGATISAQASQDKIDKARELDKEDAKSSDSDTK